MFTSSDPNLADLDFELVEETQQNQLLNESMINDLLSSSSPATYRIVKPMYLTAQKYFLEIFFFCLF